MQRKSASKDSRLVTWYYCFLYNAGVTVVPWGLWRLFYLYIYHKVFQLFTLEYPMNKVSERIVIGTHEATTWTPVFFLATFCIFVHQTIRDRRIDQLFTCGMLWLKHIRRTSWGATNIAKNVRKGIWYLLKLRSLCWILCPARAKKGFYLPGNVIHAGTQFLEFIEERNNTYHILPITEMLSDLITLINSERPKM